MFGKKKSLLGLDIGSSEVKAVELTEVGSKPYQLIHDTIRKFYDSAHGPDIENPPEIRAWIQGYSWGYTNFGPQFMQDQINGARDAGATGYMIWNAFNRYESAWGLFRQKM